MMLHACCALVCYCFEAKLYEASSTLGVLRTVYTTSEHCTIRVIIGEAGWTTGLLVLIQRITKL
jgi:hypothetical protein